MTVVNKVKSSDHKIKRLGSDAFTAIQAPSSSSLDPPPEIDFFDVSDYFEYKENFGT